MDSVKFDDAYEERVRDLEGRAYFVKALRASHLPFLSANPRVTLPALFVQQYCDKLQKSVELQNEATGRTWTVQLTVHNPRKLMQVLFHGRGWSDFATSNGLVEGDRLIFVLTGISAFGVSIFQNHGARTSAVSDEHVPMERWRKTIETSVTSTDSESRGCKEIKDTTNLHPKIESESVRNVSDEVLAKKTRIAEEEKVKFGSATEVWINVPLNSPRSSPNFFAQGTDGGSPLKSCRSSDQSPPVDLSDDQKLRISLERGQGGVCQTSIKSENHHVYDQHRQLNFPRLKKHQVAHPSFLKLLTVDNYLHYLEFPCHFVRKWGSELQATHVKLQGIYDGSPERIVACTWGKDIRQMSRLFLTDGWREFQAENDLEAGLVLGFTLTADSFFVVRGFHL